MGVRVSPPRGDWVLCREDYGTPILDTDRHNFPHLQVEYSEANAGFAIESGEILSGELPKAKVRLVEAWIELHRDKLMADWRLAPEGQQFFRIDPLK